MGGGGVMPPMMAPSNQTTNSLVQPVKLGSMFGTPPGNVSKTRVTKNHEHMNVVNNSNVADGANAQIEAADKDGKDDDNGELV